MLSSLYLPLQKKCVMSAKQTTNKGVVAIPGNARLLLRSSADRRSSQLFLKLSYTLVDFSLKLNQFQGIVIEHLRRIVAAFLNCCL